MDEFLDNNDHLIEAIANYMEHEDNVTPSSRDVWNALHLVSFDRLDLFPNSLKVVIMLQDPYPKPGAAMGVAMATTNGTIQQTLSNFHKRMRETVGVERLRSGDIRGLALQGVLMMNASFTTLNNKINAHVDAWSIFTRQLVNWLTETFPFLIFVFLGRKAAEYADMVTDRDKHPVITTSHPSGLGYFHGFHECDIFNEINEHLVRHHRDPIDWNDIYYT